MVVSERHASYWVSAQNRLIIVQNWFEELRGLVPTN